MKRAVTSAVGVAAVAAVALLAGTAAGTAKTKKAEIQFWHAMAGQLGETVSAVVTRFNQSQEEVEVKAVYKGTYPEVLAAANAAYRKKAAPHIVQIFDIGTQSMLLSDLFLPVGRVMKQQQVEIDWADLIKTATTYYSKDGKLLSLPFNATTPILYFNKDAFRKAGLGDTPPATWPEVEAASRKILASGAATCGFSTTGACWTMLENTFAWHNQPFATNQNGFTDLDTRLLINSEFGRMHVGALARWAREGIFSRGEGGAVDPRFVSGECAMFVQTSGFIGTFKESLQFDWGTGQLPHWGPPYKKATSSLGGASLWVLRGRPPEEYKGVASFLKFLVEPTQQEWLAPTTGWIPISTIAVRKLRADGFYDKHPEYWSGISQFINADPSLKSRGIRLGNYSQVRDAIELELDQIFRGKKTAAEGLDDAVQRGNAILREFYLNNGAAPQGEI